MRTKILVVNKKGTLFRREKPMQKEPYLQSPKKTAQGLLLVRVGGREYGFSSTGLYRDFDKDPTILP